MPTRYTLSGIPRRAILTIGVVLIAILIAATIVVLAVLRNEMLDRAEWHLDNLASALSEQVWQSVYSLDLLGKTTADEVKVHLSGKRPHSDAEIAARLKERVQALPGLRMLAFVDPAGVPVLHSSGIDTAVVNFSDREHFKVHLDQRIDGLYVGRPVYGRLMPEWLDVFSRRVEDEQGRLKGVVFLAVSKIYFPKLFAAIDLGEGGRVLLFRDDGVLIANHPADERAYGRSFAEDALFATALPAAPSGVTRRADWTDRNPQVVAYRRVTGFPLVVAVSATEDFLLAPWRRDAWRIGAGAAGAALIMAMALFYLLQQMRTGARLQHDLLETGARLRSIIHSAMDAIITTDHEQRIVQFNDAAEKIFRCREREAIGSPLERFIPERFRAAHRAHVERFGATRVTTRMMGGRIELSGLRADGEEFPIDASISQVTVDGNKYFTVILRDIAERKNAEDALKRSYDELRELSGAMHDVREAERTRIARELHDELAQWLTAIKMDVSWLSSRLPREQTQLVDKTEKVKVLVDTTVNAVRRIAADLRPVMLDDLGLVPAIESLLHDLSRRTGIVISLDAGSGELDFREPLATALYRMAQEALTNVARHAGATEVRVTIKHEDDKLVLQVRDNGKGFDPEAAARRKSYGVLGIQERAYTLGARATITRIGTGGTLVEIVVPVARYLKRGHGE